MSLFNSHSYPYETLSVNNLKVHNETQLNDVLVRRYKSNITGNFVDFFYIQNAGVISSSGSGPFSNTLSYNDTTNNFIGNSNILNVSVVIDDNVNDKFFQVATSEVEFDKTTKVLTKTFSSATDYDGLSFSIYVVLSK